MRVVFFGTPDFSVPTLRALGATEHRPFLVVSQPARRVGRGRRLEDPPVARWAQQHGIDVAQPEKVRQQSFLDSLGAVEPDVAVVVAFGQIFPPRLLEIPRLGCVNVHASLLPRHRGAAPIQAAIAAGDSETGVCTMQMEAGLDTGPVLLSASTPIGMDEDAPALGDRLAKLGASLVVPTLEGLAAGGLDLTPQDPSLATLAPRLSKEDGWVDWDETAEVLWRKSRAYRPWPGLSTRCRGERLKILAARPGSGAAVSLRPGTLLGVEGDALFVAAGGGSTLLLEAVQRPGRGVVSGAELQRALGLSAGKCEFMKGGGEAASAR